MEGIGNLIRLLLATSISLVIVPIIVGRFIFLTPTFFSLKRGELDEQTICIPCGVVAWNRSWLSSLLVFISRTYL